MPDTIDRFHAWRRERQSVITAQRGTEQADRLAELDRDAIALAHDLADLVTTATTAASEIRRALYDQAAAFTCGEANAVAALLAALLSEDASRTFLAEHARGDDDPSDLHHHEAAR